MSKLDCRVLGMISTNCYLFTNDALDECIIVDPADRADVIAQMVESSKAKPVAILLTHGHFDHIGAVDELRKKYNIKVYAADAEKDLLESPYKNLSSDYGLNFTIKADVYLKDGEEFELAGFKIKAIHTPGHTEGGMCFYFPEESIMFTGDTLFYESVGRSDFPTGSMSSLVREIKNKLFVLPDETICYPGHGQETSIMHEKAYNPFVY
ncbi:MBL fold metallo-hydrolase [Lachnospira pectinoschiza]|uniref:Glyoxylase, beta-lactamase superfamily II n=1 Tax=Lachnospira pectinoschiza TaxID=28052 RepID=A0A1G9U7E3_9FIRM|nr:MBL fold metallo-hydrolase [Lachnospira pectinoschiza]SDM55475.1 Glyoxylase, beta-lactamase superfamily II [Lachnospira pectinoschiza]